MKKLFFLILFLHTLLLVHSCGETDEPVTTGNSQTPIASFPHEYELIAFQNLEMPRRTVENVDYDITFPVASDSWDAITYEQSRSSVIWIGQYGPRYLAGNTSTLRQDMHGGLDTHKVFTSNGEDFDCDNGNPAKIYSICDGIVYSFREEKNDVFIECDELLSYADGSTSKLRSVYRHLSSVKSEVMVQNGNTYRVEKGEYIGEMGSKAATNCHLHFDLRDEDYYLHPGRLFNPNTTPYYRALVNTEDVDIRMLDYSSESKEAYFRVAIRGNLLSTVEIQIENSEMKLDETLNFELQQRISESSERDNPIFNKWAIFAYPFNGYISAENRYENVKDEIPLLYPGSTERNIHYPISSSDHELYREASIVYDLVVFNVEESDLPYFELTLCDIYGNCVSNK